MSEHKFYLRWILANSIGEAIGLGTTFILGMLFAPLLTQEHNIWVTLAELLIAVLLGTLLEGVVVGFCQGRILCERLPQIRLQEWIVATALGAGVAWSIGMLPSTIISLLTLERSSNSSPPAEPSAIGQYTLAILLGLITGPILGFAQTVILRKYYVDRAGPWLWANAIAWAVGMLLIFMGMDFVPWERRDLITAVSLVLVSMLSGAAVGSIHGRVLLNMTRDRQVSNL
jgi:hypothetical protein